jgi:hypothetical protein
MFNNQCAGICPPLVISGNSSNQLYTVRESKNNIKSSVARTGHIHGKRRYKINYKSDSYCYVDVPVLRISGIWMQNFNFYYGDQISIKTSKNKIVITKPGRLKPTIK